MKEIAVAVIVGLAGFAPAQLVNPGFELAAFDDGGYSTNGAPGWSSKDGTWGSWNIYPGYIFFSAEAPEGTQIGYANGSAMAQQSTATLELGTIELSAMAGRRADSYAGSFQMQLWAGGTVTDGDVANGSLIASVDFVFTSIDPSSFKKIALSYVASEGDANLGKLLSVRFQKTWGVQINVDDVRLGPVPEPASLAVLAIGSLALLKRRKK